MKHLKTALVALVHAIAMIGRLLKLQKEHKSIIKTVHMSCVLYPEVCVRNRIKYNFTLIATTAFQMSPFIFHGRFKV